MKSLLLLVTLALCLFSMAFAVPDNIDAYNRISRQAKDGRPIEKNPAPSVPTQNKPARRISLKDKLKSSAG